MFNLCGGFLTGTIVCVQHQSSHMDRMGSGGLCILYDLCFVRPIFTKHNQTQAFLATDWLRALWWASTSDVKFHFFGSVAAFCLYICFLICLFLVFVAACCDWKRCWGMWWECAEAFKSQTMKAKELETPKILINSCGFVTMGNTFNISHIRSIVDSETCMDDDWWLLLEPGDPALSIKWRYNQIQADHS